MNKLFNFFRAEKKIEETYANNYMGPGEPVDPIEQQRVYGRQFDYDQGENYYNRPKENEGYTFDMLRQVADNYDLIRIIIEKRKSQVSRVNWKFVVKDKDKMNKRTLRNIEKLTEFFEYPDGENNFETWIRSLIEDVLVTDAPAILVRRTVGGDISKLQIIDGASLKRLILPDGRTPQPPLPAYQQIILGTHAVNYTTDEIIYCPRNVRSNKVYGYSPVEQVVTTAHIGKLKMNYQEKFFQSGSIPEALANVPDDWTTEQIKEFQDYWDSTIGTMKKKRSLIFIPGDMKIYETKKDALKDNHDEWLVKIIAFAFNVDPQGLITTVNRATAESAQKAELQDGLAPLLSWIESVINKIVSLYFGIKDVVFTFDVDKAVDPLVNAKINEIYVRAGVKSINEVRDEIGLKKFAKDFIYNENGNIREIELINGNLLPVDVVGKDNKDTNEGDLNPNVIDDKENELTDELKKSITGVICNGNLFTDDL